MLIDWSRSMLQTYDFYVVDTATWQDSKRLTSVLSATITRDIESDTLGYATIDLDDDIGECYIRIYLKCIQNGYINRYPLGTYLVQTLPTSFDGKKKEYSVDAYSPLLELTEKLPPLGYTIMGDKNILEAAYEIASSNCRAPVTKPSGGKTLNDPSIKMKSMTADQEDNWLDFINKMLSSCDYHIEVNEMGVISFAPNQTIKSLASKYTFNDNNSSILYPDVSISKDLYKIPNALEVVVSKSNGFLRSYVTNESVGSPTSIQARGRIIQDREVNPEGVGSPNQAQLDEYARNRLKVLSSTCDELTFEHGYYPLQIYDGVRINYERANLINISGRIKQQTIECSPGTKVKSIIEYESTLWEGNK